MHAFPLIAEAAKALRAARASAQPIAPVAAAYGLATIDDAYAVAALNTAVRIAGGGRITGRKIGLTSRAVQKQLGVDQPDFGVLFADMEYLNGATIPIDRLLQPKIEAEIAFIVASDLDAARTPSWGEFLACLGPALPAMEIVDSAIADWKISLFDTVADNASSGLYVVGDQPIAIGGAQLAELEMRMSVNGEIVSRGKGEACLDHPLRAAFWLARTVAARGEALRAGEIILSGALGPMASVRSGDAVAADFGAFGRVSCRFE
jgi:2-keto-4-pentenoate hydratase